MKKQVAESMITIVGALLMAAAAGLIGFVAMAVWAAGFVIEGVSDSQKRAFRNNPANADRFISTGL